MADSECTMEEWYAEIEKKFDEVFTIEDNLDAAAEMLFNNFFEEAILEEVFDAHKSERQISIAEQGIAEEDIKEFQIHEGSDDYMFGRQFDVESSMTLCLRCPRRYITSKFTGHLTDCFCKSRSSSQAAKLKIAKTFIKNACGEISDDEWKATPVKRKRRKIMDKKKGQNKGSIKRGKPKNKKK